MSRFKEKAPVAKFSKACAPSRISTSSSSSSLACLSGFIKAWGRPFDVQTMCGLEKVKTGCALCSVTFGNWHSLALRKSRVSCGGGWGKRECCWFILPVPVDFSLFIIGIGAYTLGALFTEMTETELRPRRGMWIDRVLHSRKLTIEGFTLSIVSLYDESSALLNNPSLLSRWLFETGHRLTRCW